MNERLRHIIQTVGTDTGGRWVSIDNIEPLVKVIAQEAIAVVQKRFMGDLNREDQEVQRCVADLKQYFGFEFEDNLLVGARFMSDKGYELSTLEKQQEFARKRNEL
jgi:hypothetical protein